MKNNKEKNKIVLYTNKNGNVELRADVEKDTLWATQAQIAQLFDVNSQAITKHIKNIFTTRELMQDSVCSKMEHTGADGKRYEVNFYNLDAIIAVGYRVNSKKATQFRIWATTTLRKYLIKGYNLNEHILSKSSQNFDDLHKAIAFMETDSGPVRGKVTLKLTKTIVK